MKFTQEQLEQIKLGKLDDELMSLISGGMGSSGSPKYKEKDVVLFRRNSGGRIYGGRIEQVYDFGITLYDVAVWNGYTYTEVFLVEEENIVRKVANPVELSGYC